MERLQQWAETILPDELLCPAYAHVYGVTSSAIARPTDTAMPQYDRLRPRNGPELDLARIAPQTVLIRYGKNPCPTRVVAQLSYSHPAFSDTSAEYQQLMLAASASRFSGACTAMNPCSEGPLRDYALHAPTSCIYLNESFIRTMLLVNEQNLMNGVVPVPTEFDHLKTSVSVYLGEPKAKVLMQVNQYWLLPARHVLAWTLGQRHRELRRRLGLYSFDLLNGKYHVVADFTLQRLRESIMANWVGRVDVRPIDSIRFHFDAAAAMDRGSGVPELHYSVTWFGSPANTETSNLMPLMELSFPSFERTLIKPEPKRIKEHSI